MRSVVGLTAHLVFSGPLHRLPGYFCAPPEFCVLNHCFAAMLFLIAIAFLLKRYGTQAVPLPVSATTSSPFDMPIFARDNLSDGCHSRTVLDILWSCLATTFACTWVSVHPNVPWRNEGKWTLFRRRIFLMFFSILAPEFMVVWAFKQWRGAVMVREAVNEASRKAFPDAQDPRRNSWTTTHGHLLQMGGFRLIATQRENFFCKGVGPVLRSPVPIEDSIRAELETERLKSMAYRLRVFRLHYIFNLESYVRKKSRRMLNKIHSHDLIPMTFYYCHQTPEGLWSNDYTSENELEDNIWKGVLTIDSLKKLLSENLITFPTITEDEINDKSKGDALSKGISLLQLTWFIVQIIARAAQGLALTELELMTAALAGLNSVMYIFWWSKPHDVRFPVVIRTKGVEKLLAKRTEDTTWSFSAEEFDLRKYLWTSIKDVLCIVHTFLVSSLKTIRNVPSYLANAIRVLPHHLNYYLSQIYRYSLRRIRELKGGKSVEPKLTNEKESSDGLAVADPEPSSGVAVNIPRILQIWQAFISVVYCFAFLFSVLAYIINFGLFVPIDQILDNNRYKGRLLPTIFDTDEQVSVFSMMFYSENADVKPLLGTASIAGALFGGVHCLAWHFNFPSHAEQIMWRTASSGVAGACVLSFLGTYIWYYLDKHKFSDFIVMLAILVLSPIIVVYPVSRLMLLVLAVTSLRSLPPSAFDIVQWVEFVPHI